MATVRAEFRKFFDFVQTKKIFWLDSFFLGVLLLGSTWFLKNNAIQKFDFFDMSPFMDAAYRVYKGQSPYVDFFYFAGPVHLYLGAAFFKVFGFTKTAIQAHVCTISALIVSCVYLLARLRLNAVVASLLALLTVFSYYGPVSHPWYDHNAWFWILLACALVTWKLPFRDVKDAQWVSGLSGILVALSLLCKTNVGIVGVVMLMGTLLFCRYPIRSLVSFSLGFFSGLALIIFTLKSPATYYYQNFQAFVPVHRLRDAFRNFRSIVDGSYHFYIGVAGLVVFLIGGTRKGWRENLPHAVLLLGLTFGTTLVVMTGSMSVLANIPTLGMEMTLLFLLVSRIPLEKAHPLQTYFRSAAFGVCLYASLLLMKVASVRAFELATWTYRATNSASTYALQTPGFEGWKSNPIYGVGVDATVKFIKENIPQSESLFILPDTTVIYGMAGRESYKGVPFTFTFTGDTVPPLGRPLAEFQSNFINNAPEWILVHDFENPVGLGYLGLDRILVADYKEVWRYGDFKILRRFANVLRSQLTTN